MSTETILVLCGGLGTRLKSITADLPKSMVDVNGEPFINLLITKWVNSGFKNIIFLLGYRSEFMKDELSKIEKNYSVQFNYSIENEQLGTGGAVLNAVNNFGLNMPFCVANGDTWMDADINEVRKSVSPSIATIEIDENTRYGEIEVKNNRVIGFKEKLLSQKKSTINAGIYKLDLSCFDEIKKKVFSLEQDLFPSLIKHKYVNSVKITGNFIDIGVPSDYRKFCQSLSDTKYEY
tara:strand:+ start:2028 stop:2732 length:705 start_codon:yes stop_codon:yes gene_type:complete